MSDTPRTDEFIGEHSEWSPAPRKNWPAFACQLERELNTANVEIERLTAKVGQLYEGAEEQNDRIKRLEEDSQRLNWLLNTGLAWRDCYNDWWKEGEWLYASQSALETIDKAKEAKL